MFEKDDADVVKLAVKNLINTLEFPPTIADVRKEITKLANVATDKPTAIDEWNAIKKAIGNSGYHADEEFEKLPPIAKKFVGAPRQLRDWGLAEDFNESVVRGQFLKQYEVLEERQRYQAMMSPEFAKLIGNITNVKTLEEGS